MSIFTELEPLIVLVGVMGLAVFERLPVLYALEEELDGACCFALEVFRSRLSASELLLDA